MLNIFDLDSGLLMNDQNRTANWLFKQSSELELLISAAIVFASIKVGNVVDEMIFSMLNHNVASNNEWLVILAVISLFTSKLLPLSIIAHFILRFYWLSLVGLRSVFKKNADSDVYQNRFSNYLQPYLDLDRHIDGIDRISSSIFAFSFLTLFAVCFSVTSVLIIVMILINGIGRYFENDIIWSILAGVNVVFLVGCGFYLVDFFTLGLFKKIKNKWFQKIYFPVYKFMGWITFAFLYRGIYYTLVQYTSRWFLGILLPLYTFLTIFLLNAGYSANRIFDERDYDFRLRGQYEKLSHYKENFDDKSVLNWPFIDSYAVPSDQGFLKLQIPITGRLEDSLLIWCDDIRPLNVARAPHWREYLNTDLNRKDFPEDFDFRANADKTLECFKNNSWVFLDDSEIKGQDYRFAKVKTPNKVLFVTTLNIDTISRGDHVLVIKIRANPDDPREYHIPFWKD